MFHGHHERSGRAGRDCGRAAHVDHVPGVRLDFGRAGHIDAAEHDSGIRRCGEDAERGAGPRMQGDALHDGRTFHGILFRHGFSQNLMVSYEKKLFSL